MEPLKSQKGIYDDPLKQLYNRESVLSMEQVGLLKRQQSKSAYFKHDEIVERLGGSFTRFHQVAYFACLINFSTEAFLVYNLAFLNLLPNYECVNSAAQ